MSSVMEAVLKLPREEKIELLHALQEDLQWDDDVLEEDDLTKEEWAEITRREKMLENGGAGFMTMNEFTKRLNDLKNDVHT
jgi:hypothetical protein